MKLKNRIVMLAMNTHYGSTEGTTTQRLINYYTERAKGGCSLIVTQTACVDVPIGRSHLYELCIHEDRFIPSLRRLAEAIKAYDVKAVLQLAHAGRVAHSAFTGGQPVAPSNIPYPGKELPRELTVEEIGALVEKFAESARRAYDAGFDAVEFHGAHRYLISTFLSPWSNRRRDGYGGSLEGRTRFLLEIVKRTREMVGRNFPLLCRIMGDEYINGGLTREESGKIARILEKAGINAVSVSAFAYNPRVPFSGSSVTPIRFPQGHLADLAANIKKFVRIPVIVSNRISTPEVAERILHEGKADLVGLGRGLIADPEFPRKALEGRVADIRPCIACNYGCIHKVGAELPMECAVNPTVGKEDEMHILPATRKRNVLVVGGGPAGMEAARVLALKGHMVTLCEKKNALGGNLILSASAPGKQDMLLLLNYLKTQVKKLGIVVRLEEEVTLEKVREMNSDVVVVATGSKPLKPNIPGVNRLNVVTAEEILSGKVESGLNVVVVGGGLVGAESALYLAYRGRRVTLIEIMGDIAIDETRLPRMFLLSELEDKNVRLLTGTLVERITNRGLVASTDGYTHTEEIKADTIVLATGAKANNELLVKLKNGISEVYAVGDCVKPRRIFHAIQDGYRVALFI